MSAHLTPVPTPGIAWTVDSLIRPEPWTRDAACQTTDPDLFFPEAPSSRVHRTTQAAKRVCGGCDVRSQCLEYALRNNEQSGIWGGLSERELRQLQKEAKR